MPSSTAFRRRLLAGTAALIALSAGLTPARAAGPAWSIVPSPSAMVADGSFSGVSCSSSAACAAVGDYENKSGKLATLAERWNGSAWTTQSTPNPSGAIKSSLRGVSCPSSTACFAVGDTDKSCCAPLTLAEAWNGTTWNVQTTPNPSGGVNSVLQGVSCSSATSCIAVGSAYNSTSGSSLAEAWNGTGWSIQTTPNPTSATFTSLSGVSCTSSTACIAVGSSTPNSGNTTTLAESWNGSSWMIQSTPNPVGATVSKLSGISCSSASACVAVGASSNGAATVTLAEVWDGSGWTIQTTPNPSGSNNTNLSGVSCLSSSFCTAVGDSNNPPSGHGDLAEGWNGTTWSIEATPKSAGSTSASLSGVVCVSPTACTSAGSFMALTGFNRTLVEAWNGVSWMIQATPNRTGAAVSALFGVSCTSSTACAAVGDGWTKTHGDQALAEGWNGTAWSIQSIPFPTGALFSGLSGVSCTSATACTAVGRSLSNTANSALAERWNGTSWTIQPTLSPSGATDTVLFGVSCTSSTACTAVGSAYDPVPNTSPTLVEAWNGTSWSVQASPNPVGANNNQLNAVSCTSSTACTAVGYDSSGTGAPVTLAEGWNGTTWMLDSTPNPSGAAASSLSGVSCTSSTACTAVGSSNSPASSSTLAEAWNGTTWSIQPTPNPKGAFSSLSGVSCITPTPCYAVGGYWYSRFAQLTLIERYS